MAARVGERQRPALLLSTTTMRTLILLLGAAAMTLTSVRLARAEETAGQILDRARALDEGERHWANRQAVLTVTTVDPEAGGRVTELVAYQRRFPGDETRTVLFVRAPGDAAGTGVLTTSRGGQPAEQWRYRPAGDRLEQITAASAAEGVLHGDLTFRDLGILEAMMRWTEADAHATLRGEEGVDSVATYAIEFEPRRADVPYRKIVLWLGRDDMTPREVHLFGDGPYPVKRIKVTAVRSEGAIPWPERVEIETPANRSRTTIEARNVVFNRKVDDELFSPRGLARGER